MGKGEVGKLWLGLWRSYFEKGAGTRSGEALDMKIEGGAEKM